MTLPICGRVLKGKTADDDLECFETGDHFCWPRARHVERFFFEILNHTKGTYARKRFKLADWQRDDLIYPLFGTTTWSEEHQAYRRQYQIAWIEIARKALAVETPVLTVNRGWVTIGDIQVGDEVYGLDGSATTVEWVSPVYCEPRYEVRSRFGRSLVAGVDHDWAVIDKRFPKRQQAKPVFPLTVATTGELLAEGLRWRDGYRFALPTHEPIKGVDASLLVDPYALGAWLGDGTSKSGAITSHESDQPFMRAQFERAGYVTNPTADSQVFYVRKLMTDLRKLGVLKNKHVPADYLEASEADRLALLQGLMDTDGWATLKGNSLIAGFCAKSEQIARSVLFLARSLGYQARLSVKARVVLNGKEYGPFHEVYWVLREHQPQPFRMPRKIKQRTGTYRQQMDSIVSINSVGVGLTKCIGVSDPRNMFLAGRDLMPTANCGKTELLAGIQLYLLFGEGEYSAELYSIAKDRSQASLCFDVAAQMVLLNPLLSKRAKVVKSTKRIIRVDTNAVYRVIAADAGSALGSNPSAVAADEILAWPNGECWDALMTGMGSKARLQPLFIAATTAGSDTESFGGLKHAEMVKVAENPELAPHIFTYIRNTPRDADPFLEETWYYANPALGDFLSIEKMRQMAADAKRDPLNLRAFEQFQLNKWVNSSVAWMPMYLYDECPGTVYPTAKRLRDAFMGRECWFGLDLAARQDLCAMCYCFPDDENCHLLWRFWVPEAQFWKLNKANQGRFKDWAEAGWIQTTEGDVLDFQTVYDDIEADSRAFVILGGDADKWSSDPVIQEVQHRTDIFDIMSYDNQFRHMSDPMHRIYEMISERKLFHHGNPVARWCFDSCEARIAPYNPDLIRPDKPNRQKTYRRIDAVSSGIMAVNAWITRGYESESMYSSSDVFMVGG